jgi:hypothetical protein
MVAAHPTRRRRRAIWAVFSEKTEDATRNPSGRERARSAAEADAATSETRARRPRGTFEANGAIDREVRARGCARRASTRAGDDATG